MEIEGLKCKYKAIIDYMHSSTGDKAKAKYSTWRDLRRKEVANNE